METTHDKKLKVINPARPNTTRNYDAFWYVSRADFS
jgi:hypothetical protein